jgi:hypothetical protein
VPDLMSIYKMARSLHRESIRASNAGEYVSYPVFMKRYNELLSQLKEVVKNTSLPISGPLHCNGPASTMRELWPGLLNEAIVSISQMVTFLEEPLSAYLEVGPEYSEQIPEQIALDIEEKLRFTIRAHPSKEVEIQDAIENLLKIRDYEFEREMVTIPYSTKYYKPDFTFDSLNAAMDVKFCNSAKDQNRIIDEINSDIPAYRSRYKNLVFVVYDTGVIRDQMAFRKGIEENNPDVRVVIIKH